MNKKVYAVATILLLAAGVVVVGGPASQAAIDQTWLNAHCKIDLFGYKSTPAELDKDTGAHAVQIVVIQESGTPYTTNVASHLEPKLEYADSWLAKSHSTVKQHWKMACRGSSSGAWLGLHYSYQQAPLTAPEGMPDADTNENGNVGCKEAKNYAVNHGGWNGKHRRYMFLLDTAISPDPERDGLPEPCSFAYNGVGYTQPEEKVPGTANPINESAGYAVIYSGVWQNSEVVRYADTLGHELYHSLGAVHADAPGSCYSAGCGAHTSETPDILGTSSYGVTRDCTQAASAAIPESPGAYMDCGRNSYWHPNPGSSNYLCTNYNIATDSFYLFNRQTRSLECPGL